MRFRPERACRTAVVGAALLVAGATAAPAALSPFYQSIREIEAILDDQRVSEALDQGDPILSIGTTGDDVYEVRTSRCTLTITIVDVPGDPELMGPRKFDLRIGKPECQ